MIMIIMDNWPSPKAKSLRFVVGKRYFYSHWLRFNFYVILNMSRAKMNLVRQKIHLCFMVAANVLEAKNVGFWIF